MKKSADKRAVTKIFGAEQIVFGTDCAPVIANVNKSPIIDADRQRIFTENGRRRLALKGVA